MRLHRFAWLVGALVLAGCSDATGPLFGRWASLGIELQATPTTTDLRLPCTLVSPLPVITPAPDGSFRVEGHAQSTSMPGGNWALTLAGAVHGDTIVADLSLRSGVQPAYTTRYIMVRGGDSQIDRFGCFA